MADKPTIVPMLFEQKSRAERMEDISRLQKWTIDCVHEAWDSGQNQVVAIRPTGFGKTFTVGSLLREKDENGEYRYKNVAFLCPTNAIKLQVRGELTSDRREPLDCIIIDTSDKKGKSEDYSHGRPYNSCVKVRLITYMMTVARTKGGKIVDDEQDEDGTGRGKMEIIPLEKIHELFSEDVDLIVMDEFHHTGANKTLVALENCICHEAAIKNAKVLGLTATYDRSDLVDAGSLLFGTNCLIPEYTYIDAVNDGILPRVQYICTDYGEWVELKKEAEDRLKEIKENGEALNNTQLRRLAVELAKFIRLHNIDNMPEAIRDKLNEHIGPEGVAATQKWLIYFPNIPELFRDKDVIIDWFKKAYPDRVIKPIIVIGSADAQNIKKRIKAEDQRRRELGIQYEVEDEPEIDYDAIEKTYKGNLSKVVTKEVGEYNPGMDDGSIILVFSVSMLLEGAHIDNVTGIMLFTTTHKYQKFYQMIGRLIDSQRFHIPVLIDMWSNYDKIKFQLGSEVITAKTSSSLGDEDNEENNGNRESTKNSRTNEAKNVIKMMMRDRIDASMSSVDHRLFLDLLKGIDHERRLRRLADQIISTPPIIPAVISRHGYTVKAITQAITEHDGHVHRIQTVEAKNRSELRSDSEVSVEDTGMFDSDTGMKFFQIKSEHSGHLTAEDLDGIELGAELGTEAWRDILNVKRKQIEDAQNDKKEEQ